MKEEMFKNYYITLWQEIIWKEYYKTAIVSNYLRMWICIFVLHCDKSKYRNRTDA